MHLYAENKVVSFLIFVHICVYLSTSGLCLPLIDLWGILSTTTYNTMLCSYKEIIQPACLPSCLFLLFFLLTFFPFLLLSFLLSFLSYVLKPGIMYHAYVKHQRWLVQTGDWKTMKNFWNPDRKWLFLIVDLLMLTTFSSFLKNRKYLGTWKNTEAE